MKDFQIIFELDGDNGRDGQYLSLIEDYPKWDYLDDYNEEDGKLEHECYKLVDLLVEKKIILRDLETTGFIILKDNILHLDYSVCTGVKEYDEDTEEEDDELDFENRKIWVDVDKEFPFADLEIDPNDPKFSLMFSDNFR